MSDKGLRNALDLIQSLMTDHFIERLQSGEISPSELNTIRQYLKDNHVVVSPEKSADLGTLGAMLPEFTDEVEDDAIFN
jgi:thiaminase